MKYVGRYNNGSGYMEWAGRPVDSIEAAKAQVSSLGWTGVDVIEVPNGKDNQGQVVATGVRGHGWKGVED